MQSFAEFMGAIRAFQESRVLLSAVELDIYTAVGDGAVASGVAQKLGTDPRATESFLNALVAMGTLEKEGATFRNTPMTARFLVAGSPDYSRPALMHTVNLWDSWSTMTESVRAGTAVGYKEMAGRDKQWMEPFIAAMHRNGLENSAPLVNAVGAEGASRLLDVGGGSGIYSIAFARANPQLRAEIFDLPDVVRMSQRYIDEAGLTGRITTRVGDLRKDELGQGYDLVLLSAICHMLSPEENRDLFARCQRALVPQGRVVIRDFVLEADKTAPRNGALFALNMLVGTPGGSSYSQDEYTAWLHEAGFGDVKRAAPDVIVGTK